MVDEAVVDALADHATVLDGAGAAQALASPPGAADVVGLGEATHGTRELVALKRRLLEHLVVHAGYRTLALECDVAGALALEAYVRRGEGDPAAALAGLQVWPWKAEELAGVLGWLRSFNEGRPAGDRVRVRGISPNATAGPAGALREYLAGTDADPPAGVEDALAALAADGPPGDEERLTDLSGAVATLADHLEDAGDGRAANRARRRCRALAQALDWQGTRAAHDGPHEAGMAHRDRVMADNVERALAEDPRGGVALWAHDSHVQRGVFDDGTAWTNAATTGEHLARRLGGRYRPLGTDVGRGSVRALAAGSDGGPTTFALGDPLPDGATAHLDAVGDSPLALDLAAAAADATLGPWFDGAPRVRWVGSVYDPDADPDHHHRRTDLPASFDALLFVAESTPTRPLAGD